MTWLDAAMGEMLKNIPDDVRVDRTFGFGDIRQVIVLAEKAIEQKSAAVREAFEARLAKALADPTHSFIRNPVFAPAGVETFKADLTFPWILRSSLLIAVYSRTEYLLLSWCESVSEEPGLSRRLRRTKATGESDPHRYLRFLRDEVGIGLGDFTTWPECASIDAYRLARNCLAHRGGVVDDEAEGTRIATLPHIFIDDELEELSEPVVRLGPGACEAAANTAEAFIGRAIAIAESHPDWDGPRVFAEKNEPSGGT